MSNVPQPVNHEESRRLARLRLSGTLTGATLGASWHVMGCITCQQADPALWTALQQAADAALQRPEDED